MSEKPAYIMDFLKAVYPESTELSVAFNNEKTCLIDATQRIAQLESELAEAKAIISEYSNRVAREINDAVQRDNGMMISREEHDKQVAELKKQMGEMKCCGNCRNSDQTAKGIECYKPRDEYLNCISCGFSLWQQGASKIGLRKSADGEVI